MKTNILISGYFGLFPVGRHSISFLSCLLKDIDNDIYINTDFLTNEGNEVLNLFFKKELESRRIKFDKELDTDFVYDFNFFPSPLPSLSIPQTDIDKFEKKKAKLKACYPVFDGSVPPLEWIDIINNKFDICLSPSAYCTHNLKRYGVKIDCMELECLVLMEEMLKIKPKELKQKKFRFGCISANETRKNLIPLLEAFSLTFSKKDNVELFVHAIQRTDVICSEQDLDEAYEKYSKNSNIILHKGFISHNEILKMWESFNAYICPQSVTGYFTTPAEAMAVGIPCILSGIPVHKELIKYVPENNNLFFVKHDLMESFMHGVFSYRNLGVKFDFDLSEYVKALRNLFNKRNTLFSEENIYQRKKGISYLTVKHLSPKYNTLVHPKVIYISNMSQKISDEGELFISQKLAEKYINFKLYKGKIIEKSVVSEFSYPEENEVIFKIIERTAETSQRIFLRCMEKSLKEKKADNIFDKYLEKIRNRIYKYQVVYPLIFIYWELKIYCALKKIFYNPNKKTKNLPYESKFIRSKR